LSWFIGRWFRIYDLDLKPTALAEEAAFMLLDGLLNPAVVVRQVEFGPVGVAFKELRLGVLLNASLRIANGVNQLLTHFLWDLFGVVVCLLIFEQRLAGCP
jgi:hypothetical protein